MKSVAAEDAEAAEYFGAVMDEMPDTAPWCEWIWRAWWTLNAGDRPHTVMGFASMGATMIRSVPSALPWSVIQKWIEVHDLSSDRAELLRHCLAKMDEVYLKWWKEAAEQDAK